MILSELKQKNMKLKRYLPAIGFLFIMVSAEAQEKPARTDSHVKKGSASLEQVSSSHAGYATPGASQQQSGGPKEAINRSQNHPTENLNGYPRYINTGNPAQDKANYYAAKQTWAAQHPELYKKLAGDRTYVHPNNNKNQ